MGSSPKVGPCLDPRKCTPLLWGLGFTGAFLSACADEK